MVSKRKKPSKLGHDPLAWISGEDVREIQEQNNVEAETPKETDSFSKDPEPLIDAPMVENKAIEAEELNNTDEITDGDSKEEVESMIDLPIYFGIAQVADVYSQMQSVLEQDSNTIEIKAEDIESIDAAAIQLLIAFSLKAKDKNKTIEWKAISSRLEEAMDVLQVKEYLGVAA